MSRFTRLVCNSCLQDIDHLWFQVLCNGLGPKARSNCQQSQLDGEMTAFITSTQDLAGAICNAANLLVKGQPMQS